MASSNKPLDPTARAFVPLGLDSGVNLKIDICMEPKLQLNTRTQGAKKEGEYANENHGTLEIVNPPEINRTSFLTFFPDANIPTIPQTQSVNLLLSGLPPDCTPRKLLSAIHGYGRIWSVSIHPPHGLTASASLSFFEVAAAHRFLQDVEQRGFRLGGGHTVRARHHPRRLAGKEHLGGGTKSRCVLVEGHPDLVNASSLPLLLRSRLLFLAGRSLAEIKEELVEVRSRYVGTGRSVVELCFHEGFCGRAGLAVDVLLLEDNPRIWSVRYGVDPCARPWLG
ncbi:hypothetical protein PG985_010776 [Apiospora marii]|uniref:RRM domain-containing protein n=1 Tax=Apiospora marii TaxID=335849 RepID=A0ABR1T496_9PEZI